MADRFVVRSLNLSAAKGVSKTPVGEVEVVAGHGIEGDAHAGPWHRQVSVLDAERILEADGGRGIATFGSFAENLTIEGADLAARSTGLRAALSMVEWAAARVFDRFVIGPVTLEVTQIGKVCHDSCAIGKALGDCIMPRMGIFCRALSSGRLRVGDGGEYIRKRFRAVVLTLSDRASRGEYEDLSGPAVASRLAEHFDRLGYGADVEREIMADERGPVAARIREAVAAGADVVFTSGGTGLGPRDAAPEAARDVVERELPGVMEMIRTKYGAAHPNALLSRGVAGAAGRTLVYNLPGSPRAVEEYLDVILPTLDHSLRMLHGFGH